MTVEVRTEPDAAWDERVQRWAGGSIFQTTHWAGYMRAYLGARPRYLLCHADGQVAGQLLILESLRGRESLSAELTPRLERFVAPLLRVFGWMEGPLSRSAAEQLDVLGACLRAADELAQVSGSTGIEEAYLPVGAADGPARAVIERSGYRPLQLATVRIDLQQPLDALWNGLKDGVARTPVRKARRQGVTIREVQSAEDVSAYHRLVEAWRRAQGLQPFPLAKYDAMRAHLKPFHAMFLAEREGVPLGGIGVWHFGAAAQLFSPVQTALARERRVYAGDLLYWHLIEWCHARGLQTLDLSGVARVPASAKERGIREFKVKWGGQIADRLMVTKVVKPGRWMLATLARRTRRAARAVMAGG